MTKELHIMSFLPKGWRQGQWMFNFLEWIARQDKRTLNQSGERCADTFYMSDKEFKGWVKQYTKYLQEYEK